MRLLLDAHTLIWAVDDPSRLGPDAMAALAEPLNGLLLSAGSIWELGIKIGLGKLALSLEFKEWIEQALKQLDAAILPITVEYVDAQRKLPRHHGDPFDRLLVAQAQVEGIPIVSADAALDKYGTQRIW